MSQLKTPTVKNEIGNYFYAIQQIHRYSYHATADHKYLGVFNSMLSAKKAINKAQGFRSKQWVTTFE